MHIPRRSDGKDYLAKEMAVRLAIRKITRREISLNQKSLHIELSKQGFPMAEMTLQRTLGDMGKTGQIIAVHHGRETIYSLPSDLMILK